MFGYLRTNRDLTLREYDTYRAYYCGLCHTLAREYGTLARALNSFEGTFLAMLVDAQKEAAPEMMTSTCIASPFAFRKAVTDAPGLDFAAAATVRAVNAKLEDDIADGDAGRRAQFLIWMGRKRVRSAENRLNELGFPLDAVKEQWETQQALEASDELDLEQAIEPSARAYATTVAHTAELAGQPQNRELLYRLGYELGKVTYLLDSYLDYPMDVRLHRFNALQGCFGLGAVETRARDFPPEVATEVRRLVWNSLQSIYTALAEIEWKQHGEIISNVLVISLRETAQRVLVETDTAALDTGTKIMQQPVRALLRSPAAAFFMLVQLPLLNFYAHTRADDPCEEIKNGICGACLNTERIWC